MKRRDFILGSAGAAGALVGQFSSAAIPCPPPTVQAKNGPATTTCVATGTAPSWYTSIAPGTWGTVPGSVLNGSPAQIAGSNGLAWSTGNANPVVPWGGGFLNTVGITVGTNFIAGTFLCIWGGGHVDYQGNEIYCFGPMESASPAWYCPRPATNPPVVNEEFDGNGNPVARHTYATLCHLPQQNCMFAAGTRFRCTDSSGGSDTPMFQFNTVSPATNQPWTQGASIPSGPSWFSAYDPVHNYVWANGAGAASPGFYDVAASKWTTGSGASGTWGNNAGSAIDSKRGIWAIFGSGSLNFYETYNGALSANGYYVPNTVGTGPSGSGCGSIIYDAINDYFVVWLNSGQSLWKLVPPASSPYRGGNAWSWSAITPTGGGTPTIEAGLGSGEEGYSSGTYGRFAFVPNLLVTGYILMNRIADPLFFYRP